MSRLKNFFIDSRTLAAVGVLAIIMFVILTAKSWRTALLIIETLIVITLLTWGVMRLWRRRKSHRASDELGEMIDEQADRAVRNVGKDKREEVAALRDRLQAAIRTIKSSKIGHTSGRAALYELPWYMIIGNPAAGKSTAIVNSGLQFPLEEQSGKVIRGVGGTRNCDWFFTTEGILLDTAGRFSVYTDDREEWLGFVDLLKRHRSRAPLNGIIIAASMADLSEKGPEFAIDLAKQLRQRVQELTERLEIFAPVYVVFTKADLIAGFSEFFQNTDSGERERVWGATTPYDISGNREAVNLFEKRFDELYQGLKEMSLAQMAMRRGQKVPPGIFTFPLEFRSIKPVLHAFITTLFEENPYQFNPVFRGFYFTSATREGMAVQHSSERIAQRFGLHQGSQRDAPGLTANGFFLADLFRRVIFADNGLVKQYTSRSKTRVRYAAFLGTVALLGLLFAGWTWSYIGNRQLLTDVRGDMNEAIAVQRGQLDLKSRLDALNILQGRIEQIESYDQDRPLSLGMGLYQGATIAKKLRKEYYIGVQELMLQPVQEKLESFLTKVNAHAGDLGKTQPPPGQGKTASASETYQPADPTDVKDAYNALKTYLMLGDESHVDVKHLYDQITRFWRGWLEANRGGMPREEMIRNAERIISFYLGHVKDPDWPQINDRLTLVEKTRENLRRVMAGLSARKRVYTEIKARASTRFPPVTVAAILGKHATESPNQAIAGSHAISGAFSRQAWEHYVKDAFERAARHKLQSNDWVLRTTESNDLTLQASPKEIRQNLIAEYKVEYAQEWRKFIQGLTIPDFGGLSRTVTAMNRLGDPANSPLRRLLKTLYVQTSWDNPSPTLNGKHEQAAQDGIIGWFKRVILRRTPHPINRAAYYVDNDDLASVGKDGGTAPDQPRLGKLGAHFSGIAQLVNAGDSGKTLLDGYLQALSRLRTRLNQIKNEGDPGPGSRKLMQQTLQGTGSELAAAQKYVQEQMLPAIPEKQRATIRPLLLRPLIQTFAAIVEPTEIEINRQWQASVYEPYRKTLANKYPFAPDSTVEASGDEIANIFGPNGAIAQFADQTLKTLVIRRGGTLAPRTWADIGLSLTPEFIQNFSQWVSPLGVQGIPARKNAGLSQPQTVFQIQPLPAPGAREYTVIIDGQRLRYRNTPPQWSNFVWPNPQGTPGVRIKAVTFDGNSIKIINFPGHFGLQKMIHSAAREREGNNMYKLSWSQGNLVVALNLRIISDPQSNGDHEGIGGLRLPKNIVGTSTATNANKPGTQ